MQAGQIRIGPAGFSYKDWQGVFYPDDLKRRKVHPLEYLAGFFDAVEINTSFYGHIKPELAKLWCRKVEAVNRQFLFTAKLHRSFTHSPIAVMEPTSAATIRPNEEDARLAREGLDALAAEGKLGALLIQFPVSFKNTGLNREYVEGLLQQMRNYPRVVEVRHDSWNDEQTLAAFAQKNVGFCNIDQPLLGRSLAPTEHVTAPVGYVRLHGRNYKQWFEAERNEDRYNYLYKTSELSEWKERIEQIASKAPNTFVVTNNHFEARAAVNGLQLKHMISGKRVAAPGILMKRYPELEAVADPTPEDGANLPLPA
jgi:uncharacterized protein YecE (DUF72 family)